ncbi:glycoside hydrolase family 31 protein [Dyadobacter psychrophilus]|uniref:Alpha-D-xyloside xylohydrolase n=1 Tax=Dyadobacter psychrophilus TaxID=651661 RepID=A0A1T5FHL2_9BACT|nr:TIM-barrel domain-containing protein [Dyadobacter psychrophilus]SKB95568.1 alpha-D-xyloside xylohydrolase [Dyadobacter psychrophilus]
MPNVSCLRSLLILLCLIPATLAAQTIQWQEIYPGVWKGVAGKPDDYDLLKAAEITPSQALAKLSKEAFPLNKAEIQVQQNNGKTYLRLPLVKNEQLFGFGLNFQTVHQRGRIMQLHADHYGKTDNGRTHAPVPFYVSSLGYGVFVNSAKYIDVYAGSNVRKDSKNPPEVMDRNTNKSWSAHPYSDAVEMLIPAQGIEIYVFAGPKPINAIQRFNLLSGGGCLPPRWGLGFTQRVHRLYTSEQVKQEAKAFEEKGFPLDFIGLEPGWQSKSYPCTFEWDKSRFPDPAGFVKEMDAMGVKINLWTNPYVSPDAAIYKPILPFTGSHTVWNGIVPDLSMPQARKILFDQFEKEHVKIGVSGYKIDEVDGFDSYLWPDVATFPSGHSSEQIRQTYGLLVQKHSFEMFRRNNARTYGLVRASNAGGASFPYVIYNDNYSHEDFITALINSGYAGVLWTPEVRASKTAEEWLRRFQTVCFSPMAMINAWSSSTQPWTFPEVAAQVKAVAELRMRMMPYWYSEFAKYHYDGTPPFRGMSLEEGFSGNVIKEKTATDLEANPYEEALIKEVKDQYMAGEFLLVAPLFTGQKSRKVILPKGKWFDFYTGKLVGDGEIITISPGLDQIPVFVKNGAIIPMMPALLHAPKAEQKVDLEIRHYGDQNGSYKLYDDDGETFAYEKGIFSWRDIKVEKQKDGKLKGSISNAEANKPSTVGNISWRYMTE